MTTARADHPDLPWLAEALGRCTTIVRQSHLVIHFVDPSNANQPGAEWQFARHIRLFDQVHGNLVLDILKDGRVGSIEFYDRLFGRDDE